MHPTAAIFGVCLDVFHYVRLASNVSRNIIVNGMDLWRVMYKNDDNHRFSYVNERHFGFMLITC